ncbi:MAG: hypothetical protein JWM68_2262 [Verrucomicrobiales bacterium]|nr:hypothetical protein [Verrucomicrobiales bacterium]
MYKIIGADQKEYGPISFEQLRSWISEGRINGQTLVMADGASQWVQISTVAEFSNMFPATPAGGLPPLSASQGKVPNYLVQSILITLCCCLPFGIAAIIFAAQVNGKLQSGDYEGAVKSSNNAKKWCWIGLIVGIITQTVVIILQLTMASKQMHF